MKYQIDPTLLQDLSSLEKDIFNFRLEQHLFNAVFALQQLYGPRPDFEKWMHKVLNQVAQAYVQRPAELRLLDLQRTQEPDWYLRPKMLGYLCYADRFAQDLPGVTGRVPYLQELGVTYLHLMPFLQTRPFPHDGGYAIQDYNKVNPSLGTMADLANLSQKLRAAGISLGTDFVCNHTAQEHEWAKKAIAGDPTYQAYYYIFPDRSLPDEYERILPIQKKYIHWQEELNGWVWSTFNPYQWDLNYHNPAVFAEMLQILFNLANQGVEIFRLNGVAYLWKQAGTKCEHLPEVHAIIQAFRLLANIVCPGIIFTTDDFPNPQDAVRYFGSGWLTGQECALTAHTQLTIMLWSMLAEKDVVLGSYSLQQTPDLPATAGWLTYLRSHDELSWAVRDDHSAHVGFSGVWHRSFLGDFYSGSYPTSFAAGRVFDCDPETLNRRVSGMTASLTGLEKALQGENEPEIELSLQRQQLLYTVLLAAGGVPVVYMGDEVGLMNDYNYEQDPEKAEDNRWLHRPGMNWAWAEQKGDKESIPGRMYHNLRHLIQTRQKCHQLHGSAKIKVDWLHNDKVFGLIRESQRGKLLLIANFTDQPQTVAGKRFQELGFGQTLREQLTDRIFSGWQDILLNPYEAMWLIPL